MDGSEDEESIKLPNTWPLEEALKSDFVNFVDEDDKKFLKFYEKEMSANPGAYLMKHSVRGNVLVINNEKFLKLPHRTGTEHDRRKIESIFSEFGFNVSIHNNLTNHEMKQILLKESQNDYSNHDCFILFILSHGNKGVVLGTDAESENKSTNVSIADIKRYFSENTSLLGKPKIFFIQACQGDQHDSGKSLNEESETISHLLTGASANYSEQSDLTQSDPNTSCYNVSENLETTDGTKIPSGADIYLSMATVEGCVSWRNKLYGTWYIQSICYVFRLYANKHDLHELMTSVNFLVSKCETKEGQFKQLPTNHSTLRKKLFFFPGLPVPCRAESDSTLKTSVFETEKNKCQRITPLKVSERVKMFENNNKESLTQSRTSLTSQKKNSRAFGSSTSAPKTDKRTKQNKQIEIQKKNEIDLLLIGKTGNGKSATGNTILGKYRFECVASSTSVTQKVDYETVCIYGRSIKVVDGPGVCDTKGITDLEEATKHLIEQMTEAVLINPEGYHALLLVVKYGGRFTAEDTDIIKWLKDIFGPDFVALYGILVVTYGDDFNSKKKKKKEKKFKEWCKEQKGVFQELLQECNNRVILFDNETDDSDSKRRDKQMKKLIQTVDELQYGGRRYTNDNFKKVEATRDSLLVKVKEPLIREKTLRQIQIIKHSLEKIGNGDVDENQVTLQELFKETEEIINSIQIEDKGSGILRDILMNVESAKISIANKIKYEQLLLETKIANEKKENEAKQKYDKDNRKREDEMQNLTKKLKLEEQKRRKEQQDEEQKRRDDDEKKRQEYERRDEKLKKEMREERETLKKSLDEQKQRFDKMLLNQEISDKEREAMKEERQQLIKEKEKEIQASRDRELRMIEENKKEKLDLIRKHEEDRREGEAELTRLLNYNDVLVEQMEYIQMQEMEFAEQNMEQLKIENDKQIANLQTIIGDNNKEYTKAIADLNEKQSREKANTDKIMTELRTQNVSFQEEIERLKKAKCRIL